MKFAHRTLVGVSILTFLFSQAYAEDVEQMSSIEVAPIVIDIISITPVLGVGLPVEKIPYNVQSFLCLRS
jgi:hypothetical protein